MILNAKARGFLKQFGAGLAAANGLDGGEESNYFSLSDPKETQLRDALLESSDFLNWITVNTRKVKYQRTHSDLKIYDPLIFL